MLLERCASVTANRRPTRSNENGNDDVNLFTKKGEHGKIKIDKVLTYLQTCTNHSYIYKEIESLSKSNGCLLSNDSTMRTLFHALLSDLKGTPDVESFYMILKLSMRMAFYHLFELAVSHSCFKDLVLKDIMYLFQLGLKEKKHAFCQMLFSKCQERINESSNGFESLVGGYVYLSQWLIEGKWKTDFDFTPLITPKLNVQSLSLLASLDKRHMNEQGISQMFKAACYLRQLDIVNKIINNSIADDKYNVSESSFAHIDELSSPAFRPLNVATKFGYKDLLCILLEAGADVNVVDEKGHSALYVACDCGNIDIVNMLLIHRAHLVPSKTPSPLHRTCEKHNTAVLRCLLESNSSIVDDFDSNGKTPLHVSIMHRNVMAVELLLEYRANPNVQDAEGGTLVHELLKSYSRDVLMVIVKDISFLTKSYQGDTIVTKLYRRPKIFKDVCEVIPTDHLSQTDVSGNTLLHHAVISGMSECAMAILKRCKDSCHVNKKGESALHLAVDNGDVSVVTELLNYGYSCQVADIDGDTPLHNASVEITKLLIQYGSGVNAQNSKLLSPLHLAAKAGHSDIIEVLIDNGADTETTDSNGDTPLHHACDSGDIKSVNILTAKVKDINKRGYKGNTPLHRATTRGCLSIVKHLLEKGAEFTTNKFNNTPMYRACLEGHLEIVELLLDKTDQLGIVGPNGYIYVLVTCLRKHWHIAKYLIEKGASPFPSSVTCQTPLSIVSDISYDSICDDLQMTTGLEGKTPLIVALDNGNNDFVEYLMNLQLRREQTTQLWDVDDNRRVLGNICRTSNLVVAKLFLKLSQLTHPDVMSIIENHRVVKSGCSVVDNVEIDRYICEIPEEVEEENTELESPLVIACKNSNHDIASMLIAFASGKDVDESSVYSIPPIHLTYDLHLPNLFSLLHKYTDIDLSIVDNSGYTIFHKACECGDVSTLELLCNGSEQQRHLLSSITTSNGEMIAHIAARKGYVDIIKLFLANSFDMSVLTSEGNNVLHLCCIYNKIQLCSHFLDHAPALCVVRNLQGEEPLDIAVKHGRKLVLREFLKSNNFSIRNYVLEKLHEFSVRAVVESDIQVLRLLFSCVSVADICGIDGNSLFHVCARAGTTECMRHMIGQCREDVDKVNKQGDSPLHVALECGHSDVASLLIPLCDVNVPNKHGVYPLHIASALVNTTMVRSLVEAKANVNAKDRFGNTPLHALCWPKQKIYRDLCPSLTSNRDTLFREFCSVYLFLISQGSDPHSRNNDGDSILHVVCCGGDIMTFHHIVETFDNLCIQNSKGKTPLHLACESGSDEIVPRLLEIMTSRGTDVNTVLSMKDSDKGSTSLHLACRGCSVQTVKCLIEAGACVDVTDNIGETPIFVATQADHVGVLQYLLPISDLTRANSCGQTLLHVSCENGYLNSLQCIIEYVIYHQESGMFRLLLNQVDSEGQTALHVACKNGHDDCAQELLKHQARLNISDRCGRTALHWTAAKCRQDVLFHLLEGDVFLSPVDRWGNTPLHWACETGHLEAAMRLLEAGADPLIRNENGSTPVQLCTSLDRFLIDRKRPICDLEEMRAKKKRTDMYEYT